MNVSCSNGFAPWDVVRRQRGSAEVVFFVIEKTGSQGFLLSLTPLMRPYIVKMTLSCPKMLCPQRILFLFGSKHMQRQNFTSSSYSWPENIISRKNFISWHFSKKF
jgi:hypothetical protein